MRILIADDSALILDRLTEMLGIFGQAEIVGSFKNGTETLDALRTLKPDLAIVDIQMPGLNGLEIIREFRKENRTVKFIILTFFSSCYHLQTAIDAGADYFFNKIDFEKVSQVVAELLAESGNHESVIPVCV
jgi:DNA-binding NarL/FixJ family response regulator